MLSIHSFLSPTTFPHSLLSLFLPVGFVSLLSWIQHPLLLSVYVWLTLLCPIQMNEVHLMFALPKLPSISIYSSHSPIMKNEKCYSLLPPFYAFPSCSPLYTLGTDPNSPFGSLFLLMNHVSSDPVRI